MRTAIVLGLFLAACGGDDGGDFPPESGVEPSQPVSALTPADVNTLCAWSIDAEGGAGHVHQCGDGFEVTTLTVAECEADLAGWTCAATVADYEACINATGGDGCKLLTEAACEIFFECSL
jgi:hypothetical protein